MSDELSLQNKELFQAIRQAENLPAQASVCVAAYKALLEETEASRQAELLALFIKMAKPVWIKIQSPQGAPTEQLLELLNQQAGTPVEGTFELFQKPGRNLDTPTLTPHVSLHQVSMDDLSRCIAKFRSLITGVLELHFNEGYAPEEFYTKLWETLAPLLAPYTDIERGICLLLVVGDGRMPYQAIPRGTRMGEEEYQEIKNAIMPQLLKLSYVLHLPTSQRTESASRILWILEELEDEKQKTVFLSSLMSGLKTTE